MAWIGNDDSRADRRTLQYWIAVMARDAADAGAASGYLQLGSGKAGPLERMQGGDGFVVYSPRTSAQGEVLQAFTAIGRVRDGPIEIGPGPGAPFRRAVEFMPASATPIRPLLPALSFIRNKAQWGAAFRFGVVRVPADDFARIARAMGRTAEIDFPTAMVQLAVTA